MILGASRKPSLGGYNPGLGAASKVGCALDVDFRKVGQGDGDSFMSHDFYGHNCTITGAEWNLDGMLFDGVADVIDLGDVSELDFAGDSSFAILSVVNMADGTVSGAIVSKYDFGNAKGWFAGYYQVGTVAQFSINNNAALARALYSAYTGERTHYVAMKDSTNPMRLYFNGKEPSVYTTQNNGVNVTSPAGLNAQIGRRQDAGGWFWKGLISEVQVFPWTVYAAQILQRAIWSRRS